jgi:hypothetical protein
MGLVVAGPVLDAARAISFVQTHGDGIERARLRYVVGDASPGLDVVATVLVGQQRDGGWAPAWMPERSGLAKTCARLTAAEQLGLTAANSQVAAALSFLAGQQQSDGTWEEAIPVERLRGVPAALRPGRPEASLALTARCAAWLAVLGGPAHLDAAMDGADALERDLADDGRLPSGAQAQWLAAGLFHHLQRTVAAERVLTRLRMVLIGEISAAGLASLVNSLAVAGVPAGHPTVRAAVVRLATLQLMDGRWVGDDTPGQDADTTLEALRAVRWFGRARAKAELAQGSSMQ